MTPEECTSATTIWDEQPELVKAGTLKEAPWFESWIEFLRTAARHGGFKVH